MSQDTGKITLQRTSTGWSARFEGEATEEIRRLFGTDVIPTAFTTAAPVKKVQDQIKAQWPKCIVSVAQ